MNRQSGFIVVAAVIIAMLLLVAAGGALLLNFQQSQPTIQSSPASATQDTEHNSSPSALPLDSVESNLDSVDINAELDAALIQLDNEASAF